MKALTMQLRPPARLLAAGGALALATVLTSCGFDYATDRIYTPAAGVNDRAANVDVLNAVVVSGQEGSGTFVASFANNDEIEPASVESLDAAGESSLEVVDFSPIEIDPGQLVNLAVEGGIPVEGEFASGDFVTFSITFGDGESVEMDVPVMPPCDEFEGLDETSTSTAECEIEEPAGGEH